MVTFLVVRSLMAQNKRVIVFRPCLGDIDNFGMSGCGFPFSKVDTFSSIVRAENVFSYVKKYPCLQFCVEMLLNGFKNK